VITVKRAEAIFLFVLFVVLPPWVTSGRGEVPTVETAPIQVETLLKTTRSWDGMPYERYPEGKPELSVLKITIPPRTTLAWHTHMMPNAAYVVSGEIRIEKRDGSLVKEIIEGDVLAEMVNTIHRGITGDKQVVLIVFYAGAQGLPLSEAAK
jgi:quercetin dioxygenase-like cupin family protein